VISRLIISKLITILKKNKIPPFLDDKLRYLDRLAIEYSAETESAIELTKIIRTMIRSKSALNIFTNVYNPLRMFVVLVRLLETFNLVVSNMGVMITDLKTELEDLALLIIDEVESPGVLRNWLLDERLYEFRIIDYFAKLNLLRILEHKKIVKTIEQIWKGNYDSRVENRDLFSALKSTDIATLYRDNDLATDRLHPIISHRYPFAFFYWLIVF